MFERKSVVGEADKLVCSECVLVVDGRKAGRASRVRCYIQAWSYLQAWEAQHGSQHDPHCH